MTFVVGASRDGIYSYLRSLAPDLWDGDFTNAHRFKTEAAAKVIAELVRGYVPDNVVVHVLPYMICEFRHDR